MFDSDKNEPNKYRYDIKLSDIDTNKVFYDKLTYIYLEMPKFNKTIDELETKFDKWLYVIKNLSRLDNLPNKLHEKVFEKLFKVAEIAKFTTDQVRSYENSLKYYRDLKNSFDTAREEGWQDGRKAGFMEGKEEGIKKGIEEGKQEGIKEGIKEGEKKAKVEILKNLISNNISLDIISKSTGFTKDEINQIIKDYNLE